jgi:hypothetical protein
MNEIESIESGETQTQQNTIQKSEVPMDIETTQSGEPIRSQVLPTVDPPERPVLRAKGAFRLTPRENELLEFVLDQKFASTQVLYFRFYQGEGSRGPRYAQERLRLMEKAGLLRPERIFTERENSYLLTGLGQSLLQGRTPSRRLQAPAQSIDIRVFEHDRRITWVRACREKEGKCQAWRSERRIQAEFSQGEGARRLVRQYLPDAIYTNKLGGKVALELELAPKTRKRWTEKIQKLREVMRSSPEIFERVLYVPCSKAVQDTLLELTRPYGDLFRVQPFSELVPVTVFSGGV